MPAAYELPPTYAEVILYDPDGSNARFNPIWLKWFVDIAKLLTESGGGGGGPFDHNLLSSLQGGTANQYYHLTSAQASATGSLVGLSGNGIVVQTGVGTYSLRTLTGDANVTVANGNGVAGNMTVALGNTAVVAGSYGNSNAVPQITVDVKGRITAANASTNLYNSIYTPTLNNTTNIDASTAFNCNYLGVNDMITVSGKVAIDPTAGATSTVLGISLPITSNITVEEDCTGVIASGNTAGLSGIIKGDAGNDRATAQFVSVSTGNEPYYFNFTYRVIA